jgi:WD40 repeat protein
MLILDDTTLILASASRDRLIHIFDASPRNGTYSFDLIQTLDDHSSTLTAMMFTDSGSKLVSCGADKAIIFRTLRDDSNLNFATYRNSPLRSTVYDMCLAQVSRTVITASQDRRLTLLNLDTGKPSRSFSPSISPLDASIKANPFLNTLTTDPTGTIICAGASDKSIHVIDSQSGTSLFQGVGHGDLVTDVSFINHGSHIASTSADGCIFLWKVTNQVFCKMGYLPRISTDSLNKMNEVSPSPITGSSTGPVFFYDENHLPGWAKTSVSNGDSDREEIPSAQGRWAEVICVI